MQTSFADKLIPWMTLLSGMSISTVAVWYSVAGLVAIFAASATAIIIMGVVLEVGKLVTAIWLHRNWTHAVRWLKTYLAIAVIFLMFITSMGIFGFLSKAHIEQTSMSGEQVAMIDTINEKVTRSEAKVKRWQEEIDRLLKTGGGDIVLATDQDAIKELRAQIKTEKDVVRTEADKRISVAENRRDKEVEAAKPLIEGWGGEEKYNAEVARAKQTEQNESRIARSDLDTKTKAIDKKYAKELSTLNKRISSARTGTTNKAKDADKRIKELEKSIELEQVSMDVVREDKMVYEKEYRKLEAEVGPIKYIAAFIYGDNPDKNVLEEAVTWVIIMIIFVFDPLAVGLLIASQNAFQWNRTGHNKPSSTEPLDAKEKKVSVLNHGKTKVIERVYEVEADVDDTTPEDIEALEQQVKDKLEK